MHRVIIDSNFPLKNVSRLPHRYFEGAVLIKAVQSSLKPRWLNVSLNISLLFWKWMISWSELGFR